MRDNQEETNKHKLNIGLLPSPVIPLPNGRGSETILSRARQQAEEPNHAVGDPVRTPRRGTVIGPHDRDSDSGARVAGAK